MLSFSTGATQTMFQPDGVNGDINVTLWPLQVFYHCTLYLMFPVCIAIHTMKMTSCTFSAGGCLLT